MSSLTVRVVRRCVSRAAGIRKLPRHNHRTAARSSGIRTAKYPPLGALPWPVSPSSGEVWCALIGPDWVKWAVPGLILETVDTVSHEQGHHQSDGCEPTG